MGYESRAVCNNCRKHSWSCGTNSIPMGVCPKCGSINPYSVEALNFVSTSKWYNPLSWGTGYYLDKKDNIIG